MMRHRLHAICPYFAMFPESFAERWIDALTRPGDVVLDPFCGRGTTPFQALLMNRRAVAADINPVAYCVTRAKTAAPAVSTLRRRLSGIERTFETRRWEPRRRQMPEFFQRAYAPPTLRQVLFLRTALDWRRSRADAMLAALTLGVLHGDSSRADYYLSNQMPRTISTKPAYSIDFWKKHELEPPVRDVFAILRDRIVYRYETPPPKGDALIFNADMRTLPRALQGFRPRIKAAVTSPPYFDMTSFEEDQWLRLWFLGYEARPTRGRLSRDDRHGTADGYWRLIADMWRVFGQVLAPKTNVVIRIGFRDRDPEQLAESLTGAATFSKRRVQLVSTEVSEIRGRQTRSFRPGSSGCRLEVDCHFAVT
jgi:hypothetical protein